MTFYVKYILVIGFLQFTFTLVECHNKYSKQNSDILDDKPTKKKDTEKTLGTGNGIYEDRPFRSQKVNLVWGKAQKNLPETELENLFIDLKIHDKLEMETKKKRSGKMDEDGSIQASTRQKLIEVLKQYGLHDYFDPDAKDNNKENEVVKDPNLSKRSGMEEIMDSKTKKLWQKAQLSGFSDVELDELRVEFQHHTERMSEFADLRNELDTMPGDRDNRVESHKYKNEKSQLSKRLKSTHMDVKNSFLELEELLQSKVGDKNDFTEPRVMKLWRYAQEANYTTEELASMKEELSHYEHKLIKYQNLKEKHENLTNKKAKHNNLYVDDSLSDKVADSSRKIKKLDKHLSGKIAEQHGIRHFEL